MDLIKFKEKYRWQFTVIGVIILILTLIYAYEESKKPQIACVTLKGQCDMTGCNKEEKVCDSIENLTKKYPWIMVAR